MNTNLITRLWYIVFLFAVFFEIASRTLIHAQQRSTPLIIDHNHNNLEEIPQQWIDAARTNFKVYFGHTSHGEQVTVGLERIEAQRGSTYNVAADWSLPNEPDALCIRDRSDTYDPDDFFPTVPEALATNPEINIVMYGWCGQPGSDDWQTLLNDYFLIWKH